MQASLLIFLFIKKEFFFNIVKIFIFVTVGASQKLIGQNFGIKKIIYLLFRIIGKINFFFNFKSYIFDFW